MKNKFSFFISLFLISIFLSFGCAGNQTVSNVNELELAVRDAANYLNSSIPNGRKLVILNFQSEYPNLSEYVIDELRSLI